MTVKSEFSNKIDEITELCVTLGGYQYAAGYLTTMLQTLAMVSISGTERQRVHDYLDDHVIALKLRIKANKTAKGGK